MAKSKKSPSSSKKSSQKRKSSPTRPPLEPGHVAQGGGQRLRSYLVGGLPIVNRLLERLQLERLLNEHLPRDDSRTQLSTARALLVLVRNVLCSREPMYGVAEWAQRFAPDLLDLWNDELEQLNDDRLGRGLERLFDTVGPPLIMAVVRRAVREFDLRLDELHNDSTSISFHGAYADAAQEETRRGRPTHAVTWGHSKDHRPDLKQLLYILTVTDDGGVPVYFTSASGNVVDDRTHCQTWDLLHELVGRPDFLYVADCKLATSENLNYVARHGGRFVSVLPATRKEDAQFRRRLRDQPPTIKWQPLYDVTDVVINEAGEERQIVRDRLSVCGDETLSSEGYRLLWFHSTRKVELDEAARARRTQRAIAALTELRERLHGPRTRFRERTKVETAVAEIVAQFDVGRWLQVEIEELEQATYRQARRGRPTADTPYRKEVTRRYTLSWRTDPQAWAAEAGGDGVFPLISNARDLTAEQVLRAYKRQPIIEKRFSQLKTDFAVAPVYLKSISRIQGLLAVYFLVLLLQTLLERELRQAMARKNITALPIYPESRSCPRPTTQRILELFDPIQRHVLTTASGDSQSFVTDLSPVQREILKLLNIPACNYGH
jgi:transposase